MRFFFRGKIRCMACSVPYCLPISWNCNSFDSYWRGDHEIILPDRLWAPLYIESSNNSRVVSGFYFFVHCTIPTSESQLNRGALSHRGSDCHHLLNHGVGSLCKPREAANNLLRTPFLAYFFRLSFFCSQCTWYSSFCFPRP